MTCRACSRPSRWRASTTGRSCFIAYTIKGFGLPLAGHKDNHAGLMTPTQMEALPGSREASAPGHEWDRFEGSMLPAGGARALPRRRAVHAQKGTRRYEAPQVAGAGKAGDRRTNRSCRPRRASG